MPRSRQLLLPVPTVSLTTSPVPLPDPWPAFVERLRVAQHDTLAARRLYQRRLRRLRLLLVSQDVLAEKWS